MSTKRRPKMPLRCAYKAYCVIVKSDGILCGREGGGNDIYSRAKDARDAIANAPESDVELAVARCYIVPAEMWENDR